LGKKLAAGAHVSYDNSVNPPAERRTIAYSAGWHFLLLFGYFLLRPLRDEIGAQYQEYLPQFWTATFVCMLVLVPLWGWVVSTFPRRIFLPWAYRIFVLQLAGFWVGMRFGTPQWVVYAEWGFYVWLSTVNLFLVSIFWSFMADQWREREGRRLYGYIAAGGSLGGIAGPLLASFAVGAVGRTGLMVIAGMIFMAIGFCIQSLLPRGAPIAEEKPPVRPGVMNGVWAILSSPYLLGVCAYLFLYSVSSGFVYFEQASIVREFLLDRSDRVVFLANIDLAVNVLTILGQLFLFRFLVHRIGPGWTLAALPVVTGVGLLTLGVYPTLTVIAVFQVLRRAANYALAKPTRELLFTVVSQREKYQAKPAVDTVVYRGGDMASAWFFSGVESLGLSLSWMAFIAAPITCVWGAIGVALGRHQRRLAEENDIPS